MDFTPRGRFPLTLELQFETPSFSHAGASPLAVPAQPCPYINRVFLLDFLNLEDGTYALSRNVGKVLPLDATLYPRRAQISSQAKITESISSFPSTARTYHSNRSARHEACPQSAVLMHKLRTRNYVGGCCL
jgi:hypothetical protein